LGKALYRNKNPVVTAVNLEKSSQVRNVMIDGDKVTYEQKTWREQDDE
jgi:hypothetical protein